jgi:hypothetical protein
MGGLTVTWDNTVILSDAPQGKAGEVAGSLTETVVSVVGTERLGVPVPSEVAGAVVGGVTEAVVGTVSSYLRRWWGKGAVISLRLPCCSGCLARSVGRIHGVGSNSVMLVLYNPEFAAEFKSLNGL